MDGAAAVGRDGLGDVVLTLVHDRVRVPKLFDQRRHFGQQRVRLLRREVGDLLLLVHADAPRRARSCSHKASTCARRSSTGPSFRMTTSAKASRCSDDA
jgi:hypothetical protein